MLKNTKAQLLFCLLYLLPVGVQLSCSSQSDSDREGIKKEVVKNYAAIVFATYSDAHQKAKELKSSVQALVAQPSAQTLEKARSAWIAARQPYEQTEPFRFYGGPVDGEKGVEGLMNGWPLDEAYIDYVQNQPASGIINHPELYPEITRELLASLNEKGGETNLSTGYHAIEFLLWGQDQSATGGGNRPHTDYVPGGTAAQQQRRGQYLLVAADLLVEQLQYLADEWNPEGKNNYYTSFTTASADSSIYKIVFGMGSLSGGELAGERMRVAYDTQDQEDEHSCFSDQTHNDLKWTQQGIVNVYTGSYTRTDGSVIKGAGLQELIKAANAELHTSLLSALQQSNTTVGAIQPPFDREIVDTAGRARVQAAIKAIDFQTEKLVEAANAIGIRIVL